jgi:hypothetical protein
VTWAYSTSESKSAPLGQADHPPLRMDADFAELVRFPKRREDSLKLDNLVKRDDPLHTVFETNPEAVRGKRLDFDNILQHGATPTAVLH